MGIIVSVIIVWHVMHHYLSLIFNWHDTKKHRALPLSLNVAGS